MPRTLADSGARSVASAAVAAVVPLLILAACGDGDAGGGRSGSDGTGSTAAETRAGTDGHRHDGGSEHSHPGGETHTHRQADTLDSGVALDPGRERGWTASATLLSLGDSVQILISLEGASSPSRHVGELTAGGCDQPGSRLASLTPVATGPSGKGSSQTTLPTGRLNGHAHGALRLVAPDGSPVACAPVHLAADEHGHGGK